MLAAGTLLVLLAGGASAQAAFSGQNGKIAFSEGGAIWTMNPDGTGHTMLRDGYEPAWSPDGNYMLFSRAYDILRMPADGSSETLVLDAPGATDDGFFAWRAPAWAPDGTRLVASKVEDGWDGLFEPISTAWADGSGIDNLNIAYGVNPAWDPNGGEIAYSDRPPGGNPGGIHAVAPGGSGERTVWEQMREFSPWPVADPDYSPDGSKIIFSTLYPGNDWQIYVIPAAGGTPVRLTNNDNADVDAVWSPDGTKIAFASDRDGNFEIYTMNADGTNQTRITNDPATQDDPSWQPVPGSSYPRPKGATPQRVPMVPAYRQCSLPTRTHGPPMSFPSCPPIAETTQLTTGTPDANGAQPNMESHVRYATVFGNPATPANEADIEIRANINDVRVLGTNADYTGEVEAQAIMRITDRNNSIGDPATTTDFVLPMTVQCVPTSSTSVGSTCFLFTSVNALTPGAIVERQRTVFQIGETRVMDGGPDGDTATSPNTIFLRQGFFVP